jgi:hypothetical protein
MKGRDTTRRVLADAVCAHAAPGGYDIPATAHVVAARCRA